MQRKGALEFAGSDRLPVLWIETRPQLTGETLEPASIGERIRQSARSLEAIMADVRSTATEIGRHFSPLAESFDSVEVTFGICIASEAGLVLTRAGVEATFEVKLKWAKAGGG